MKILHINAVDGGGAAIAAIRLHQGLLGLGVESRLLTLEKTRGDVPEHYKFYPLKKTRLHRLLLAIKRKYLEVRNNRVVAGRLNPAESFTFPDSPYRIDNHPLYKEADIINLHWTPRFLDYKTFFKDKKKKIVWTMHDINPFSDGCHYPGTCRGWKEDVPCAHLVGTRFSWYSKRILKTKKDAVRNSLLYPVSPSQWLKEISETSTVFRQFKHHHIPNSVPRSIFNQKDREYSRSLLGLPNDKLVLLFVAHALGDKRKGYPILLEALSKIDSTSIALCSVGAKQFKKNQNEHIIEIGNVRDELLMSIVYAAADVLIVPSLEDNLPNTCLESLMCGTPLIGFPVGGIKEIIQDGVNGILSHETTAESLASSIQAFIENPGRFSREKIREMAIQEYDLPVQAGRYLSLYKEIMASS